MANLIEHLGLRKESSGPERSGISDRIFGAVTGKFMTREKWNIWLNFGAETGKFRAREE